MIKIIVKTMGTFTEVFGFRERTIEVKGRTVRDLVELLKLKLGEIFTERVLDEDKSNIKPYVKVLVNGIGIDTLSRLDTEIKDGDVVAIFPPVGGGQENWI